jgi:thiosulfate sulfurtransferase
METFQTRSAQQTHQMLKDLGESAKLVDIRDFQSFTLSHAPGAFHLTNESMMTLMDEVDFDQPIFVMCYHGISSQGAAQYLINQGYEEVYSIEGGFEGWRREQLPTIQMG